MAGTVIGVTASGIGETTLLFTRATSAGASYVTGSAAWEDVQVHFSCVDGGSGADPATTTLVPVRTVTADGETRSVTSSGTCVDRAGNTASPRRSVPF